MDKLNSKFLLAIVTILILIIIGITVYGELKNKEEVIDTNTLTQEEITSRVNNEIEQRTELNLASMDEGNRINAYVKEFFDAIGEKNYEEAYEMLYPEFRENKYPTIEDFTNYVTSNFPQHISLTYDNIERNGDYYYLWITAKSLTATKDAGSASFVFALKEYDINDFALSFSIK